MEIRSLPPMSSDIRSWSVEDVVALVTKLQVPHDMFRGTSSRARMTLLQARKVASHRPTDPRAPVSNADALGSFTFGPACQTKFQTKLKSWSSQSALLTGCGARRSHGGQCNALCAQQGKKVPGNGLRIFSQQKTWNSLCHLQCC